MAKLSPLQKVRDEHGSKYTLAGKLIEILDKPEGEPEEEFEDRIHTMANTKLLRLWDAHQRLEEEYGSKEELVEEITEARFPGGNDDYKETLMGYHLNRLFDLARQHGV